MKFKDKTINEVFQLLNKYKINDLNLLLNKVLTKKKCENKTFYDLRNSCATELIRHLYFASKNDDKIKIKNRKKRELLVEKLFNMTVNLLSEHSVVYDYKNIKDALKKAQINVVLSDDEKQSIESLLNMYEQGVANHEFYKFIMLEYGKNKLKEFIHENYDDLTIFAKQLGELDNISVFLDEGFFKQADKIYDFIKEYFKDFDIIDLLFAADVKSSIDGILLDLKTNSKSVKQSYHLLKSLKNALKESKLNPFLDLEELMHKNLDELYYGIFNPVVYMSCNQLDLDFYQAMMTNYVDQFINYVIKDIDENRKDINSTIGNLFEDYFLISTLYNKLLRKDERMNLPTSDLKQDCIQKNLTIKDEVILKELPMKNYVKVDFVLLCHENDKKYAVLLELHNYTSDNESKILNDARKLAIISKHLNEDHDLRTNVELDNLIDLNELKKQSSVISLEDYLIVPAIMCNKVNLKAHEKLSDYCLQNNYELPIVLLPGVFNYDGGQVLSELIRNRFKKHDESINGKNHVLNQYPKIIKDSLKDLKTENEQLYSNFIKKNEAFNELIKPLMQALKQAIPYYEGHLLNKKKVRSIIRKELETLA